MDFDILSDNDEMAVNWIYDPVKKAFFDTETDEKLPFSFNPDTGVFVTSKGISLQINAVNKFILAEFMNNFRKNEPLPPKHKVQVSENEFTTEYNTNDTHWKLEYNKFHEDANLQLFKFMITMSIDAIVPNDIELRLKRMAKRVGVDTENGTWEDDKIYYFVQDSVGSDIRELSAFMEVLKGRNLITKEALKRSEARFSDDSSRDESTNIPTAS
jgi:hypothetical protein